MGRPELKGREVSVYAPSKEHLIRWKKKAESLGLPLSGWVSDLIECKIEEGETGTSVARTRTSDEINRLRKENVELKKENSRLIEVANALKRSGTPAQPSWSVMEHLKDGHYWKWEELVRGSRTTSKPTNGDWIIVDAISGKKKRVPEPSEAEIIAFKDELLYTSVTVLSKDTVSKTLTIRPRDHAGAGDGIRIRHVETVSDTLEKLESLGLIENNPRGWRWIK